MKKNIIITGASGFIGSHLHEYLSPYFNVYCLSRRPMPCIPPCKYIPMDSTLTALQSFLSLNPVCCFLHVAGLAHGKKVNSRKPSMQDYYYSNTVLTLKLAKLCSDFGVNKFVFFSSIAVYGNSFSFAERRSVDSPLMPKSPYGVSKAMAEHGLLNLSRHSKLNCKILRLPLVYSENCDVGNLRRLSFLLKLRVPLPLGNISNSRAFIHLSSLCDFVYSLLNAPWDESCIFNPVDAQHYSTSSFVEHYSRLKFGRSPVLFPLPISFILKKIAPGLFFSLYSDFCVVPSRFMNKFRDGRL